MSVLSLAELQALAASVGFPNPALAASIAMAESGGNASVVGDIQYGGSVGLWQINLPAHPEYDAESLKDPTYNANAAFAISQKGTDFRPWTTYRTGAYIKWYQPSGGGWPSGMGLPIFAILAGAGYLTKAMWVPLVKPLIYWVF